ncbi:hypothetical protein SEMRO_1144_G246100.1 [Seminavis robusta]|uniref:Uncharacterized protein n=1 Tax=Seminavis robusta TaxID=568900 RepID=A0A9N8HQ92_9STRA|nr:hypothetical protein SEMRO_1144_G246100.1 [Seminavis robusta]|eukprot:Sro1144_g246100.1 n/a (219) ;mRNA; r:21772-22428
MGSISAMDFTQHDHEVHLLPGLDLPERVDQKPNCPCRRSSMTGTQNEAPHENLPFCVVSKMPSTKAPSLPRRSLSIPSLEGLVGDEPYAMKKACPTTETKDLKCGPCPFPSIIKVVGVGRIATEVDGWQDNHETVYQHSTALKRRSAPTLPTRQLSNSSLLSGSDSLANSSCSGCAAEPIQKEERHVVAKKVQDVPPALPLRRGCYKRHPCRDYAFAA